MLGQAKRFSSEIASGVKRSFDVLKQATLEGLKLEIDAMAATVRKVVSQTKARVFGGDVHVEGKVLSVFETSTEVIRKGKASKPTEFGKMVTIQEAENQIVIDFEVYDERPSDSDLLIPSIEVHQELMGRTPNLVASDAGLYSARNVTKAEQMGVKRVSVPNRSTKSKTRREHRRSVGSRKGRSGEPAAREESAS